MKRFERNVSLSKKGKQDIHALRNAALATAIIVGGTIVFLVLRLV